MPSSLTKSFVRFFGISPSGYRQTKNYQIMTTNAPLPEVKLSKGKYTDTHMC